MIQTMRSRALGLVMLAGLLTGCPKTTRPRDAGADAGPRDAGALAPDGGAPPDGGSPPDAGPPDAGVPEDGGGPRVILDVDFQASPTGAYSDPRVRADWPGTRWTMSSRATIVDEGGERFVRILYPAGAWGSATSGAQWQVGFPSAHQELWLRYRVRFRAGFDAVRGGKLPGLIGGEANTGGDAPDGTDGWSGRMMWRSGLDAVQYVYHPDQPTTYGEDFQWAIGGQRRFVPGTWHTIEHRVVMNTPGAHDGIIQGWFDGELALDTRDLRFRDVSTFAIDGLYFSTFFGGSTADWAPSSDQVVDFDDFVVSTGHVPLD